MTVAAAHPILLDGVRRPGADSPERLLIQGGRIAAREAPADGTILRLDAEGLLVLPGLIDLQINGAAGRDLTAEPGSLWDVGAALGRFGVTAFLPTIVTSPPAVGEAARRAWLGGPPAGYRGATPLGVHLEGPFLSPGRLGAHDPAHVRGVDADLAAGWSAATGVRMVTLAPELPGALELAAALAGRGVVVAAGHSLATVAQATAGFDAGIRYATHLFNAMPALDHRAPGLAAAALADPRVTVGLIPDGLHVHPTMVDLAWRAAGPDRLSIVTDAIAALGMPPGRYPFGDADLSLQHDGARLDDGTLAGSVIGLAAGLLNLISFTGAPLETAAAAATRVPAALLGDASRGALRPGTRADVVVLSERLEVVVTIADGVVIHGEHDDRWR
jgi:N-acetylglucosamine-6-phosphate deacetylase